MVHAVETLKRWVIDALFPEFCLFCGKEGYVLCSPCASMLPLQLLHGCPFCDRVSMNGITCDACKEKTPLAGVFSFGLYSEPRVRELIVALKYRGKRDLALILGTRIAAVIASAAKQSPIFSGHLIFTAVPLPPSRRKARGYNQSELLARAIAERIGFPYINLLERTRLTTPQVEIHGVKERLANVRKAFALSCHPELVEGRRVILADDVVTTGATLSACARALKKSGVAAVYGLTIARG